MESRCTPRVRSPYAWETQEARHVFANQLQYERIRIHECTTWPNAINRVGTWMKKMVYAGIPNAITLGNHCYFPIMLLETPVPANHPKFYYISWLMHELTHCWQYQHLGWRYLSMTLSAQMREGEKAYQFGGEKGLIDRYNESWTFADFNLEQQGDIVRTYYERLMRGEDISAWLPFITEIQQAI